MSYNIIISGTSSGIGQQLGNYLTEKGHKVTGLSRNINRENNFETLRCDITNFDSLRETLNKITKVDCLINNAGIAKSKVKNEKKNFEEIIKTNLIGTYDLTYLLQKKLAKSNKASIINVCSVSGHQGAFNNPGYVSSKSALLGLTRALANDYSKKGIRVNSISPGYIKTSMTMKSFKSNKRRKLINSRILLKKWGEPKDLFSLFEYLLSEEAKYITGQDFVVDGGWLIKGV